MEKEEKKNNYDFEIIKISKHSNVNRVAGAIAAMFNERGFAKTRAIGAAAFNQMIKASIIARSMLSEKCNTAIIPSFSTINIDGMETSALDFKIIKISSEEN